MSELIPKWKGVADTIRAHLVTMGKFGSYHKRVLINLTNLCTNSRIDDKETLDVLWLSYRLLAAEVRRLIFE